MLFDDLPIKNGDFSQFATINNQRGFMDLWIDHEIYEAYQKIHTMGPPPNVM